MVEEAQPAERPDYVSRLRETLVLAQLRHEEFIRQETRPASQKEIAQFNLFIHTYWAFRNSDVIDIATFSHLTFEIDGKTWELPEALLARTVDGEAIRHSRHWRDFISDWSKLREECEDRRIAQWDAEEAERREVREAATLGKIIGQYFIAEEKAYYLLLSCLTEEQKRSFWYERYFMVTGPDGERFRIENRNHGNIVALDEGNQRYCGVCEGFTPKCDSFLAQKFWLENDPNRLLSVSNRVDEI